MELRQLAVVVAVAEEGGFTAAAQRLRTVQSTVSTVVRALERDLGTPLFHRTTHRVVLTPAGEAFVPAARAALAAAERARAAVAPVGGRVRVGVCPGLLLDLPRVLATLRHVHPGLGVQVRQVAAAKAEDAVAESVVDVALAAVAGDTPGADGFATQVLAEELVLVTAPGGSRSAPADLAGLSLVDFPPGWAVREAVDRAFPCREVGLEVDDLGVAGGIVRAGLAACVLPESAAARFADLTVRRFERPSPWRVAAVHRGDPAVAAFLAQLR
ncbi:LysR family transcriptional regulator [Amycolatopsis australiensis]|uniref:DNA-binding transcriptional regulator, LysR family n=1 Tax=Amycolatopsis australiensis TaxID=546364 RepID=A0A1K1SEZ7_9PSEU|nr:LysR family transcriptional regulator [Amycolatopsis australiensis]SFW82960.1 DNA-binding transcriptional regulator, LysR family [Amycolatopsis australiensis]